MMSVGVGRPVWMEVVRWVRREAEVRVWVRRVWRRVLDMLCREGKEVAEGEIRMMAIVESFVGLRWDLVRFLVEVVDWEDERLDVEVVRRGEPGLLVAGFEALLPRGSWGSSIVMKLTYMCKYPLLLNPGKQIGIQDSPPLALTPSASKIMLKISWRSEA